jgi:hypothetical protein
LDWRDPPPVEPPEDDDVAGGADDEVDDEVGLDEDGLDEVLMVVLVEVIDDDDAGVEDCGAAVEVERSAEDCASTEEFPVAVVTSVVGATEKSMEEVGIDTTTVELDRAWERTLALWRAHRLRERRPSGVTDRLTARP